MSNEEPDDVAWREAVELVGGLLRFSEETTGGQIRLYGPQSSGWRTGDCAELAERICRAIVDRAKAELRAEMESPATPPAQPGDASKGNRTEETAAASEDRP